MAVNPIAANLPPSGIGAELNIEAIRDDFPILAREVHGKPLVYLDNAATTQKPQAVIEAVSDFYSNYNANVHRGVHTLSETATEAFEGARETVRGFLNASSVREIVFTRGTTEAINLVADCCGRAWLAPGDEVLITAIEHHSNIVPWQMLRERYGIKLVVAPIDETGTVRMDEFERLLSDRTRLVAAVHISNALGTVNPVAEMTRLAHGVGAKVLIDGAQATPHVAVDVKEIGCDFYVFSGHKVFGPTGIGVLYGRETLLEELPPYQGGGDMIREVTFERTEYNDLPYKYEAGTANIAGAIGLKAALDYVKGIDGDALVRHEQALLGHATELAAGIDGLKVIGTSPHKASVLSFNIEGAHPHDLGMLLDHEGVAVRAGHHCAMPVMQFFGVPGTARASFAIYNTQDEVTRLFEALQRVTRMLL